MLLTRMGTNLFPAGVVTGPDRRKLLSGKAEKVFYHFLNRDWGFP